MSTADLEIIDALKGAYCGQVESVRQPQEDTSKHPSRQHAQDTIQLGLCIYEMLKSHAEEWASSVEGGTAFGWDASDAFAKYFAWWLGCSRTIAAGITSLHKNYPAEYKNLRRWDDFRAAIRDVSLMCLDTDRTKAAIESLEAGQGIPLERAREDLRGGRQ